MKEKIPCEVIEDLLPLYAEELTQAVTGEVIKEHIDQCETCKRKYENMMNQLGREHLEAETAREEINYLKKIKRSNQKKIVLAAFLTILIAAAGISLKLYVIGYPLENYETETAVTGGQLEVKGEISDMDHVYSSYKIKDGEIVVYGSLPSFFNRRRQFAITYDLSKGDIAVNGDTIKSDGTIITKKANDLFQNRNPYIGDMPANGKIAQTLEIYRSLGEYKNELQTTREPYGWTLLFQKEVLPANQIKFDSMMESYAAAILALIDNCGEVTWTYSSGQQTVKKTYTLEEANKRFGNDIKSYAASPQKVQELLDLLNIK
ncbi:DUF4825 domain-containing protein [Lacrimispora sp.]|uniref:DUF4825 domain-containing protein n=1 Tax=Lacrimispora sp. TaxID=2719234 RepID=UPI003996B831